MKKLSSLILLGLVLVFAAPAFADTAKLQVIHNSADPAAEMVDVYINGDLALDDFEFRTATPFLEVPAGVELNIAVAPGTSSSVDDALATFPVTLASGKTYVAMANGVLDPSMFADNPDGESTAFTLFPNDRAREGSFIPSRVALMAFHGATDAPTVDINPRNVWGPWYNITNLTYGEFSRYKFFRGNEYIFDVTPAGDPETVVASFVADLNGLEGGAAVVFASGFLNPDNNMNGASFGLFAALPNGDVIELPAYSPTARLQVIHNAADPAAEMVDIYVNGDLFLDDFAFRAATPFVDVPAGVELAIGVAPGNSESSDDIIATIPVTLEAGKTYVAIANGVLDPTMFAENPDGQSIGFNLYARDGVRESARWGRNLVDLIAFHGATDAPSVDVVLRNLWGKKAADDLTYGQFSDYASLWPKSYILDVTPAGDNNTIVASFEADLSGLGGGAGVVFASGFLSPEDNMNGAPFGLFVALPSGDVVELPAFTPMARLQVIHNSADAAADPVDIYVNGDLFLDNFYFRTATPFVDVPAGVELAIGVAPGTSESSDDIIATVPVTLEAGKTYVAIANGVLDPSSYAPNPDGISTAFNLFARDDISEGTRFGNFVKLLAFHGASDAPTVDIYFKRNYRWKIFDGLSYTEFSDYRALPAWDYVVEVTPAGDGKTVVASFEADLSGLGGGAAVVFASGFLNPADNNDGAAFGLFAALPSGDVMELPAVGGDDEALAKQTNELIPNSYALNQNYPNPFNPATTISFSLPNAADVSLRIYNVLGQEVETIVDGPMEAGQHQVTFDATNLSSGMYFYRLKSGSFTETRKMTLVK